MKIPAAMIILVSAFSLSFPAGAAMPDPAFRTYPWSDESPTLRIDKKLLPTLPIPAFEKLASDAGPWPLSEVFVEIFKLTAAEVGEITNALQNALHDYRTVESATANKLNCPKPCDGFSKAETPRRATAISAFASSRFQTAPMAFAPASKTRCLQPWARNGQPIF